MRALRGAGWRRTLAAIWCVGAVACCAASECFAVQLVYEPFTVGNNPGEYHVGSIGGQPTISTGSFFAGPWVAPPDQEGQVIQATSITPNTPGGSVTANGNGRAGRYLAEPWTTATTGVFYLSYMARYGTVSDPETNDPLAVGFRTSELWPVGNEIGQDIGRTQIGYDAFVGAPVERIPRSARLAFKPPGGAAQPLTDATFNDDDNSPHLLVLKFELSNQPHSDAISVFLDPFGNLEPLIPNGYAAGLDFTLGAIGTVSYFSVDSAGGIAPTFDELRVGTTFADVMPPTVPNGPCSGPEVGYACYLEIISHMHLTGDEVGYGDLTGDDRVSIADFRLWKDQWTGASPGAGTLSATSVPEPGTWLLALGLATMLAVRIAPSRSN